MNYTEIQSYDCPSCKWSLHVEWTVWEKFPHKNILDYIHMKIKNHVKQEHDDAISPLYESAVASSISPYFQWPGKKGDE